MSSCFTEPYNTLLRLQTPLIALYFRLVRPLNVGLYLPRPLVLGDQAFLRGAHAGNDGHLPKASAQVSAQQLQPIEIALPHVWRAVKVTEDRMGPRIWSPVKQFLIAHELPDAGNHSIHEQKQWPILYVRKLYLLVHQKCPDFLERGHRPVDAIVAALEGRQYPPVLVPDHDFTR